MLDWGDILKVKPAVFPDGLAIGGERKKTDKMNFKEVRQ